jgi:hypothetical protein
MSNAQQIRSFLLAVSLTAWSAQPVSLAGDGPLGAHTTREHKPTRQELTKTPQRVPQQQSKQPEYSISIVSNLVVLDVLVTEREYQTAQTRNRVAAIGYLQSKNQLRTFANFTGGIACFPRFEGEISGIFRSVVGFLRNEYDHGFSPFTESLDRKYRKLKVEIVARDGRSLRVVDKRGRTPKVLVYSRKGHVAKTGASKQ